MPGKNYDESPCDSPATCSAKAKKIAREQKEAPQQASSSSNTMGGVESIKGSSTRRQSAMDEIMKSMPR